MAKKNEKLGEYLTSFDKSEYVIYQKTVYTKTPFISGLGAGHPTETGMILDRNTGVPYIPASSVKGVVRRAYAINRIEEIRKTDKNCTELEDDDVEFVKYFGSMDANDASRGNIVFFDAYPSEIPELKVDIINPHFQNYYGDQAEHRLPLENETTNPINFLTVKENSAFTFRCLYRLKENDKIRIRIIDTFDTNYLAEIVEE